MLAISATDDVDLRASVLANRGSARDTTIDNNHMHHDVDAICMYDTYLS